MNELHIAAFHGSIESTIALLARGSINIDQGDRAGWTPLICAAQEGHSHVARILLSRGANVSMVANDGATALHFSARFGHLAVTADLVKAGAELEAKESDGSTPLRAAAEGGHLEAMEALIEAGADVDTRDREGMTPLHAAAGGGHSGVMSALIEAGADVDSRSWGDGCTPLYMAAQDGHVDAVKMLLRAKANTLMARTTVQGELVFPLEMAAQEGHPEVVQELIQQVGIEGCGGNSGGVGALDLAAMGQHVDVMAILTDAGVVDTGIALGNAAGCGREVAVKFLLRQRQLRGYPTGLVGYVNYRDSVGMTPLFSSIHVDHDEEKIAYLISPKVVRLLIDAGADTSSAVRVTKSGVMYIDGTPLAFTNSCLSKKKVGRIEEDATEEQMYRLEAVRRLLLRVEAVHAVSWLWHREPQLVGGEPADSNRAAMETRASGSQLASMLSKLRPRRRGVLLAPVFSLGENPLCLSRYSSYS